MNTPFKANLMLLLVTIFWGSSYLFMKIGLVVIEEFNLIALRFGIAFLLSAIVFRRRLVHAIYQTIKCGFHHSWDSPTRICGIVGTVIFNIFGNA